MVRIRARESAQDTVLSLSTPVWWMTAALISVP
jgi:hypothetical protein